MNDKQTERAKFTKSQRRREERRRAQWETFPQRILRKIDELDMSEETIDAVYMEIILAKPAPEVVVEIRDEIVRMIARRKKIGTKSVPVRFDSETRINVMNAQIRLNMEIRLLECALVAAVEYLGGENDAEDD